MEHGRPHQFSDSLPYSLVRLVPRLETLPDEEQATKVAVQVKKTHESYTIVEPGNECERCKVEC
jgi:hypothetical protein